MYSASAVNKATLCLSLLLYETGPPSIMLLCYVRERRVTPSVKEESCHNRRLVEMLPLNVRQ
jgi:hypothetical protein